MAETNISYNDFFQNEFTEQFSSELTINYCGWQKCVGGHDYGPYARDVFLVHYIVSGHGIFVANNTTYNLGAGDAFLCFPTEFTYYKADEIDPWEYCWVGFSGSKAGELLKMAGLDKDNTIFTYNKDSFILDCFQHINEISNDLDKWEFSSIGYLYLILTKLIEEHKIARTSSETSANPYVKLAVKYINHNYFRNLQISEVADYVNINRSHLFRLFKMHLNISPQQYLIKCRINKSCSYLKSTLLSIEEISSSVGFDNVQYFYRVFKKETGITPAGYRKQSLSPDI